jgi:hypothetical protein
MADNTCETLQQRTAFLQMMMPPVRFEGVTNPYLNTNFTPSQLDMRRKAEILQYNKNSTQTNKPTRANKFKNAIGRNINVGTSFIGTISGTTLTVSSVSSGIITVGQSVSGNGVRSGTVITEQSQTTGKTGTYTVNLSQTIAVATFMYTNVNTNISNCANDLYIPSLSSSSDVPGPVVTLQYVPTVPLYNYAQNTASLGLINTEDNSKWIDSTKDDIVSYDSIETVLLDLAITKIETSSTTFTINSPIGIYVDGIASGASIIGNVNINSIEVSVYYNDANYLLTSPIAPVITTLNELKSKTVSYVVTDPSSSISKQFSGVKYIGNLNIANLTLPTRNGYVYKIKLKFKLTSSRTGTYSSFNTRVYMNVSTSTTDSLVNCTFSSPDSTSLSPRVPYYISDV